MNASQHAVTSNRFTIAFVCLAILSIAPFWLFQHLLLTDYGEHLLIAQILAQYKNSNFDFEQNFVVYEEPLQPYGIFYTFHKLVSPLLDIETSGRLFFSLYFFLLPYSIYILLKTIAPDRVYGSLLAFPLAFNLFAIAGMINFVFAVPLVILFLALLLKARQISHGRAEWILLALLALLIYFSHILAYLIVLLASAISVFALKFTLKKIRHTAMALAPSVFLFSVWTIQRKFVNGGSDTFIWEPLRDRLIYLLQPFFIYWDWRKNFLAFDWIYLLFCIIFISLVAASILSGSLSELEGVVRHWVILLAALFLGATLLFPFLISENTASHRYSLYFALSLLPFLPAKLLLRPFVRSSLILLVALMLLTNTARLFLLNEEGKVFSHLVKHMEPRSSVLPLYFEMHTRGLNSFPVLHAVCHYHYRKGGISPYLFAELKHLPVHPAQRDGDIKHEMPGLWTPERFQWENHSKGFRYFMVRGNDERVLDQLGKHATLIFQEKEWKLFERKFVEEP